MARGASLAASPSLRLRAPPVQDGRCKTLDAAADGYMRGEACVVHLIEAAPDENEAAAAADEAAAAGIHAAAVLLGTAVNQDGRSSSLTAPNGPSQQAAVRAALAWGGVAAAEVGVLELHGTGTALGDPIEVGAALTALQVGRLEWTAAGQRLAGTGWGTEPTHSRRK